MKNLTIGLLGGSFNPPHEGHVYISNQAMKVIGLDKVWWIVAKHNPLKNKEEYEDFSLRLKNARIITMKHRKIEVLDIEKFLNNSYSYKVVLLLKAKFRNINFVWIMGSDNLLNMHLWSQWKYFCQLLPILVLERHNFVYNSLKSRFATLFKYCYFQNTKNILLCKIPAWSFVRIKNCKVSSSELRKIV